MEWRVVEWRVVECLAVQERTVVLLYRRRDPQLIQAHRRAEYRVDQTAPLVALAVEFQPVPLVVEFQPVPLAVEFQLVPPVVESRVDQELALQVAESVALVGLAALAAPVFEFDRSPAFSLREWVHVNSNRPWRIDLMSFVRGDFSLPAAFKPQRAVLKSRLNSLRWKIENNRGPARNLRLKSLP